MHSRSALSRVHLPFIYSSSIFLNTVSHPREIGTVHLKILVFLLSFLFSEERAFRKEQTIEFRNFTRFYTHITPVFFLLLNTSVIKIYISTYRNKKKS